VSTLNRYGLEERRPYQGDEVEQALPARAHNAFFGAGLSELKGWRIAFPRFLLLLCPIFSSCTVGPNYRRPSVDAPAVFRGASNGAQQASFADQPWWALFHDETLTNLIKTSLANNYDLAAAVTRVEQARQIAAQARAQYFPALGYTSILSYGHNQFTGSPASNLPGAQGFFLGIARAAWEPDLWGRIRRTNEAARAQYFASEDVRRGVMLSLTSDASQAYFELLGLRLSLEIARETTQSYTTTLALFNKRLQEGIGNALQTSRAAADLDTAAASIPEFERTIALKENQISVLLGKNPGPIETKIKLLDETIPPEVPAGLPSSLLERRPDVLAAEQNVRDASARIGVAQAAFFPTIGLTTFFGKLSTPLANLTSSNTNAWSLAANASGPIYQGGALKAQKREAVAYWHQTRVEYLRTVLNAFRDVSDALVSREQYEAIRAEQIRAVQSNQEALRLAQMRYLDGLSSYFEVLEAQQRLYPARLALAQTEINRRLVVVQLYKALGGGWNLTDTQWTSPAVPPIVQTPHKN
jgi:outer membrane protein, multidrug efflux system